MLYPSVDLMYQAKGLTDIMNNVTQNESPCSIPRLTLIVSIFSFPFLVFISIEISQVLTIFLMKSISTTGTPWHSKHRNCQGWETESNAFFKSTQVQVRFLRLNWASSRTILSTNKLSVHPMGSGFPPLWSSCSMFWLASILRRLWLMTAVINL